MTEPLDAADRDFLRRLHRRDGATIRDLCDDLAVTATAVRQRLLRLSAARLVDRRERRMGRGRPVFVYNVSDDGLRQLGDNYSELAVVLWEELRAIPDQAVRAVVFGKIRESLIKRYSRDVDANSLQDRLDQLRRTLVEHGFDVEIDSREGLTVLRENSCPYFDLATADPAICEMEQQVFERVLGTPISLTQRCVDGHTCCEFAAVSQS